MDILIATAEKIADYAIAPIGRQLGYTIFYRSNVENLKTQVQNLEEAKEGVQHSIDAAKRNGEDIEVNVQNWLNRVNETVAEAKRFHDNEGHARVGCSSRSIPNLWLRHQLSRRAKRMAQGVSEILAVGKFDKVSYRASSQVTITASARGYESLESRTSTLNKIKQVLKNDKIFLIGVHGMSGVGKTTLVNELAWNVEQDGSFDAVVIATVTSSPDVKRIQGQIADELGLKFDEETEEGRARRLRERIRKEKTILVILDDIWNKLDLTEVGVPFHDDHKGCKLLLTSRDHNVLNWMGTQKDFKLEVLSEEDSWYLFKKMVGDSVDDFNIRPVAEKVAKCCAGLPLLIVTMAKALRNKDVYTWKASLNQLKSFDHEGLHQKIYSALELSYNYLETEELKSIFLFIGSLGLNYIHSGELFSCCQGLGLYKHVDTLTDARNRHHKLINDLKASSLLLESETEWVRIHDIVLDVAKSIASRSQPTYAVQRFTRIEQWPKIDQLQKYHNFIFPWSYIHELPEMLECPELKLLLLQNIHDYLKVPDSFFSGMREVKVLDLHGMMLTPFLPPSLCHLKNLRTLYILGCLLEDIAIVAELVSLETLSLERSDIKKLPIEIRQLTHLRMLSLSNCSGLRVIPENLLSSLTCLEELYMGNCFIQWEVEGSKSQSNNASLGELRNLHKLKALDILIQDASAIPRNLKVFSKLERYNIFIGNIWKWSFYWSHGAYESTRTRTLKLKECLSTNILLDHGVKLLLNTVEDLCLAELKYTRNILYELNEEGFPLLKHLHIQNSVELQHIINSMEWPQYNHAFPNLEALVLHNLVNMEEIIHGPLPTQSFNKLKIIKVKGCHKLKNLLLYSQVRNLSQLLEMEISECKLMKEIIVDEQPEDNGEMGNVMFPKLHSLTLDCLPMLVSFCSMPLATNIKFKDCDREYEDAQFISPAIIDEKVALPNLETMKLSSINIWKIWNDNLSAHSFIQNLSSLTVDRCNGLKYLFSSSMAKALVKLHYLEITNCQMLEEIFFIKGKTSNLPSASKALSNEEVAFPNLETLIISQMDSLKSIWHDQLAPKSFCKLKKMEIKFCNILLNAFPSHVLNKLHNLETMVVANCDALEVVYEMQGLNTGARSNYSLRMLTLKHLPVLKHIWSRDPHDSLSFQNLCTVIVKECRSLNYIVSFSVAKELLHLKKLYIKNCEIENIVSKDEIANTAPRFVFPRLTSLSFRGLSRLRSFYPGTHSLDCPILKELTIFHCDKLEPFKLKPQNYKERVPVDPQPLFSIEKVIHNLEELALDSKDFTKICNGQFDDDLIYTVKNLRLRCFHDESEKFPSSFLKKFTNLESLKVSCSSFLEVLLTEHTETTINLKSLMVIGLENLMYLCKEKSEMKPTFQNLETLHVSECPRLKNIVPSSVLFQNLDYLCVAKCAGLVNLIMSSTAKSFLKLTTLFISECEMIEEIVASEDEEEASEIAFMKLEHLQLEKLPRLARFSKANYIFNFPLLKTIFVIDCPMLETFSQGMISAPMLRKVCVTQKGDEWRWEGDLNTTIKKVYSEMNFKED